MYEHDVEDSEVLRAEYRRPRDVLLSLVGEFMCRATLRMQEIYRRNNQEGKIIELLDVRSHVVSKGSGVEAVVYLEEHLETSDDLLRLSIITF